ncbi:MAG TPA: carboxypeptidase-like regulatory domain-containing protein [Terriglobales bacterium]|nr:carboxypeptidase-like regulatory domain-containing protein [Terriglobales bacterium]
MYVRAVRLGSFCFLSVCLISTAAWAQGAPSLSGRIKGNSGAAVAGAKVTVKNLTTERTQQTQTNENGEYRFENLAPGDYEVEATASGFEAQQSKVTVAPGGAQTADLSMNPTLSLSDLGFGAPQTQGSAKQQALLNKRSHMLHVHQELGLITTVPLVATVLTGFTAGGRSTSSTTRDVHAALGSTTALLYGATAYYAIFAPKIPGTKTEGPIKLHKALAWIHGPGMVLTPILGAMAFEQKSKGEKVHGIAGAHGTVAVTTAIAYGLAIYSVWRPSFPRSKHDMTGMSAPPESASPMHPDYLSVAKPMYDALDGTAMPGSKQARAQLAVSSATEFEHSIGGR